MNDEAQDDLPEYLEPAADDEPDEQYEPVRSLSDEDELDDDDYESLIIEDPESFK